MENENKKNQSQKRVFSRPSFPNIILVGGTASGKTTVGYQLSKILELGFVDLDLLIEKYAKKSIVEIFNAEGESGFRQREAQTIETLSTIKNHVIVTGGGTLEPEDNWQALKKLGPIVWLATPTSEVVRRLTGSPVEIKKRPLLADALLVEEGEPRRKFLTEKLEAMLARRKGRFDEADYSLSCSFATAETCAQFIKSNLLANG